MSEHKSRLKSCLYCGSDGVRSGYADKLYFVKCEGCGVSVWSTSKDKAIESWNERQIDEVD